MQQGRLDHEFYASIEHGRATGLFHDDDAQTIGKGEEKVIAIQHTFMIKHISEDTDGNLSLVGTIIQKVAGVSMPQDDTESFHFNKFRFNDVTGELNRAFASAKGVLGRGGAVGG